MNQLIACEIADQARIRVILVPVGNIDADSFRVYARLLARNDSMRLDDVADGGAVHHFKEAKLMFNFCTSHQPENAFLEEFQVHRQVLGVIGIVHCKANPDLTDAYKQFADLTTRFPKAVSYRCIAFDPDEEQPDNVRGVTVIPSVGDQEFYAKTLMEDFAGSMLSAFNIGAIEKRSAINTPVHPKHVGLVAASPQVDSPLPSSTLGTFESVARYYRSTSTTTPTSSGFSPYGQSPAGLSSPRPQTPDQSVRKRTPARAQKLLGDLYIVAARYGEAIRAYTLAIEGARASADYLWQASALEGLCSAVAILARAATADPSGDLGPLPALSSFMGAAAGSTTVSASSLGDSPAQTTTSAQIRTHAREIAATYREIVALYERGQAWGVVYAEACLKIARWISSPTTAKLAAGAASVKVIGRMEEVSLWLNRGWVYAQPTLGIPERIHLATAAAEVCSGAGGRRKRAFWLRCVTSLVFPVLRREMEESLQTGDLGDMDEALQKRVIGCLARVCPSYGVEEYVPGKAELLRPKGALAAMMDDWESESDFFGWPVIQVEVLRECIAVSETLGDYDGVISYATRLLRNFHQIMSREDQHRTMQLLERVVRDGLSDLPAGSTVDAAWWKDSFFRSLKIARSTSSRIPHPRKRLPVSKDSDAKNFFIVDPYGKKNTAAPATLLVVGEMAQIAVDVWNPYEVDLEVQTIQLKTEGVRFDMEPQKAILMAGEETTLRLNGIPREPGALVICGIEVVAFGGLRQQFTVVMEEDKDVEKFIGLQRKTFEINQRTISKHLGIKAYDQMQICMAGVIQATEEVDLPPMKVDVVDRMPLMRIKSTSLAHGAMMLFEGESAKMTITLENIGQVPVDFLAPSFSETAAAAANQLKTSKATREDSYEQDNYAATTFAFHWEGQVTGEMPIISVSPGQEYALVISVFGKRNCAGGTITLDYGFHTECTGETVYTRQLSVPVMLTVRKAIDIVEMDALAFHPGLMTGDLEIAKAINNAGAPEGAGERCLVSYDVRNTWSAPITVNMSIKSEVEGEDSVMMSASIHPGFTQRILLPVKRIELDREAAIQPIPTAKNKQFILAKITKANQAQEELSRRLFWYKDMLLENINATWSCSPGRFGSLDLRTIRLSENMLDSLRAPEISVDVSLKNGSAEASASLVELAPGKFRCKALGYVTIAYTISNRLNEAAKVFFRVQPMLDQNNGKANFALEDYVVFTGQLQASIPALTAGSSYVHAQNVCPLSGGRYTFACHVEELKTRTIFQGPTVTLEVEP